MHLVVLFKGDQLPLLCHCHHGILSISLHSTHLAALWKLQLFWIPAYCEYLSRHPAKASLKNAQHYVTHGSDHCWHTLFIITNNLKYKNNKHGNNDNMMNIHILQPPLKSGCVALFPCKKKGNHWNSNTFFSISASVASAFLQR